MDTYVLTPSNRKDKKWQVITPDGRRTIHFGNSNYQDYTQHHTASRMRNYLQRHQKRENWGKDGINTAGWWARWLLWSKPNLDDAIDYIEKKFKIHIYKLP